MTADELKQDVLAWIRENPNAPRRWIGIAERLSTYQDMEPAWRELAKRGIKGRHVMSMANNAADAAVSEMRRTLPSAEEIERLSAVEDAARNLIAAINRAPLLDAADFINIDGKPAVFAWRDSGKKSAAGIGCPWQIVDLHELLEYAAARAAELRQAVPARMVKRQRSDPTAAMFVRHLAALIQYETGKKMMGTVARIATAVLDRPEQITKQQVESILRAPS